MNNKITILPPAQLWIGPHEHLSAETELFLQQQFCPYNACSTCTVCRQIREHQFHGAVWLYPEKRYTLEQLNVISETISFSLAQDQKLFFIIQKADFLTTACSNSLLKSVDEPPPGYHFIFCAHRKEQILPTIRSRCIIKTYQEPTAEHEKEELLSFFKNTKPSIPAEFVKVLEKLRPHEQESIELLDKLLIYWMQQAKQYAAEGDTLKYKYAVKTIGILGKAFKKPPMPGSSIIFWKNLFLQLN